MPIQVTCACGKVYRFKDEVAGKRAKCPACGGVVSIPRKSAPPPCVGDSSIPPQRPATPPCGRAELSATLSSLKLEEIGREEPADEGEAKRKQAVMELLLADEGRCTMPALQQLAADSSCPNDRQRAIWGLGVIAAGSRSVECLNVLAQDKTIPQGIRLEAMNSLLREDRGAATALLHTIFGDAENKEFHEAAKRLLPSVQPGKNIAARVFCIAAYAIAAVAAFQGNWSYVMYGSSHDRSGDRTFIPFMSAFAIVYVGASFVSRWTLVISMLITAIVISMLVTYPMVEAPRHLWAQNLSFFLYIAAFLAALLTLSSEWRSHRSSVSATPTRRSRLAMLSLVLSSLFLLGPFAAIPAVVTGHLARRAIKKNQGLRGLDLAGAGLFAGYGVIVLWLAILPIAALVKGTTDQAKLAVKEEHRVVRRTTEEITRLMHDCESDNAGTRWRAAALLSTYNPAAISVLTDALDSPAADVRWCACIALARMAPNAPTTLEKLKTVMSKDADSAVRQAAQLAAHRIGGKEVALEPGTVALTTSVKPGEISIGVKPVHLFEMLDRAEQLDQPAK